MVRAQLPAGRANARPMIRSLRRQTGPADCASLNPPNALRAYQMSPPAIWAISARARLVRQEAAGAAR